MNYCPVIFGQVTDGHADRLQTEYDAYEPTVRGAQVGSMKMTRMIYGIDSLNFPLSRHLEYGIISSAPGLSIKKSYPYP